jgi:hypothetical protein
VRLSAELGCFFVDLKAIKDFLDRRMGNCKTTKHLRCTVQTGSRADIHSDVGFLFAGIRGERAVPKERTRERNKDSQRRKEQPGFDDRHRDSDGQIREKRGDIRIDSLRRIYGDSFAPGILGEAHLRTLLERTGSNSLSDYLKTTAQLSVGPQESGIRYASDPRTDRHDSPGPD